MGGSQMQHDRGAATAEGLSGEELAAELATDLPDREAMSTFGQLAHGFENVAMPINEATAANIYSTGSIAAADADQVVIIDQGIDADGQAEEPASDAKGGPKK
jgi:hypothetical protein